MTIAQRLTDIGAWPDSDSRCIPIVVKDPSRPDLACEWIATTGSPENAEYGIEDVAEEEYAGHWILIVYGTDDTTCWWDEDNEVWTPGLPM